MWIEINLTIILTQDEILGLDGLEGLDAVWPSAGSLAGPRQLSAAQQQQPLTANLISAVSSVSPIIAAFSESWQTDSTDKLIFNICFKPPH